MLPNNKILIFSVLLCFFGSVSVLFLSNLTVDYLLVITLLVIISLIIFSLLVKKEITYIFLPIIISICLLNPRQKIYIGAWPIMIIDYAFGIFIIYFFIMIYLRKRKKVTKQRMDKLVIALILLNSFSLILGFFKGYDLYDLSRDVRFPVYLSLTYFSITRIVSDNSKLNLFISLSIFFSLLGAGVNIIRFVEGEFPGANLLHLYMFIIMLGIILYTETDIRLKSLRILIIWFFALSFILSGKRMVFFGMLLTFITLFIFCKDKTLKISKYIIIIASLTIFVGSILYFSPVTNEMLSDVLRHQIEYTSMQANDYSNLDPLRFSEWFEAYNEFIEHPFVGRGLGYTHTMFVYGVGYIEGYSWYHNSYLFYLVKMGLVGIAVILFLLFIQIKTSFQTFKRLPGGYLRGVSLGTLIFSILCFIGPFIGTGAAIGLETSGVILGMMFSFNSVVERLSKSNDQECVCN